MFTHFNVDDVPVGDTFVELLSQFNIDGIRLSEAAFQKLQQEISWSSARWNCAVVGWESARPVSRARPGGPGSVPHDSDPQGHVALADRGTTRAWWTRQRYYEVCTKALYACLTGRAVGAKPNRDKLAGWNGMATLLPELPARHL